MWKRAFLDEIPVDLECPLEVLKQIAVWVSNPEVSQQIVTLNANIIMQARRDPLLREIINRASLISCDGMGIVWALQHHGFAVEQLTGLAILRELLKQAMLLKEKVYCYGGTPQLVERLSLVIERDWSGLELRVADGYGIAKSEAWVHKELLAWQPRLLIVGLGSPKQEYFLAEMLPQLSATIGIGVGGALEILAGFRVEAPNWIRQNGGEWIFRLLQDFRKLKRLPDLFRFYHLFLRKDTARNLPQLVEVLPEVKD